MDAGIEARCVYLYPVMSKKNIIALTMGDPGGIGPEIIQKTLQDPALRKQFIPLVIGSRHAFDALLKDRVSSRVVYRNIRETDGESFFFDGEDEEVPFLDITGRAGELLRQKGDSKDPERISKGVLSPVNGALALASLEKAAELACSGRVRAIVTAPLNKTAIRFLEPEFSGHTEFFAQRAGETRFAMMFVSPRLKITLATVHVPLKEVSRLLTTEGILDKIDLTDCFFRECLHVTRPKLGVCALNPHGEETGTEETEVIAPAVAKAAQQGIDVHGPFSSDQLFYEAFHGRYDGLISMYHDQALCPFKMIAFHEGVNVTLGLPFIRTSPDHGTAFDIAYQNKAQEASFASAVKLACEFASS